MPEQREENYWVTVLVYFASFLIGLGIIAEIAFNWAHIPNHIKLIGAGVAMVINALALLWCMTGQKKILTQVVACIYGFLIMGVIGLIGQIFQLQANPENACLLWAFISWPLFIAAPRLLWLWLPMFFYGIRYLPPMFDEAIRGEIFGEWSGRADANLTIFYRWLAVVGSYALLCAYEVWQSFGSKTDNMVRYPLRFYSGVVIWGLYCRAAFYGENLASQWGFWHEIVVPALLLSGIFWVLNKKFRRFSFMPLFLLGLFAEYALILTSQYFNAAEPLWLRKSVLHIASTEQYLPFVFLLLMFAYAYYHKMPRLRIASIIALVMWFIATYSYDMFDLTPSLMLCATVGGCAYYARNRKWFNIAVIAAVLRVLGEYAYVDNLQYFGLYLIVAGVLLILTVLFLTRYSRKLWEKIDEK